MKIGSYDFNVDWWRSLGYDVFAEKYKYLNLEKLTGLSISKLAVRLGIKKDLPE